MEVREGQELGLAVAALDLALHGGEHLLGLARDPMRLEEEDNDEWGPCVGERGREFSGVDCE